MKSVEKNEKKKNYEQKNGCNLIKYFKGENYFRLGDVSCWFSIENQKILNVLLGIIKRGEIMDFLFKVEEWN